MSGASTTTALLPPASSAQALAPVQQTELRALKSSLDELDGDDVEAIGKVVVGASPARAQKYLGVTIGTFAAMGLCAVSPVGGLAMLAGIAGLVAVGGKRDIRKDLVEVGLSPALIEQLVAQVTLATTTRTEFLPLRGRRRWAWTDTAHHRQVGDNIVAAARRAAEFSGRDGG